MFLLTGIKPSYLLSKRCFSEMCKHVLDEPVGGRKRSLLYSQLHKFSHPFSRPLHITILEPVTGYLPHCEKGWFVRSVNTMKIGWSSWPYLKICVYCLTRSLLPFWVDQFCYHHASVTTSVYVDGCASVKLLLYAMGAEMLSAVSNFCDGQSFTPDAQTRD